jgi:hypothetical protein
MTRILRLVPMPPSEQEALATQLAVLRDRQERRRAHLAAQMAALLAARDAEIELLEQRLAATA